MLSFDRTTDPSMNLEIVETKRILFWYVLFFLFPFFLFVEFLIEASRTKPTNYPIILPYVAVFLFFTIRFLLGPTKIRLSSTTLEIFTLRKKESLPLKEIVSIRSGLLKSCSPKNKKLYIYTKDKVIRVPRFMTVPNKELMEQILAYRADYLPEHQAEPPTESLHPINWSRYPNAPHQISSVALEHHQEFPEFRPYLFGGPIIKLSSLRTFCRIFLIFTLATIIAIELFGNSQRNPPSDTGSSFIVFGFALFLLFLTFKKIKQPYRNSWLYIHNKGLVLKKNRTEGELFWNEIAQVYPAIPAGFMLSTQQIPRYSLSGFFCIKTKDDALIIIGDIYDIPVQIICNLITRLAKENKTS